MSHIIFIYARTPAHVRAHKQTPSSSFSARGRNNYFAYLLGEARKKFFLLSKEFSRFFSFSFLCLRSGNYAHMIDSFAVCYERAAPNSAKKFAPAV
jgi:hypothetical protein